MHGYWLRFARGPSNWISRIEAEFRRRGKRVRKTISSAWLSLISTLATDWWKILIEISPFFLRGCLRRVATILCGRNNILSSRRRRKSESRPGRQAEEKTERRATQKGKTSLPFLPFSSSLTIYPFGTTVHPPTFSRAIPSILVCIHRITAPCLILRHCFLFISLYFLFFFSSCFRLGFPIIRKN